MEQGQLAEAEQALRRCLELFAPAHPLRPRFAGLLRQLRRWQGSDGQLEAFLAGKGAPAEAATQLQMADLPQRPFRPPTPTAARLYRDALARQPRFAAAHRYDAACSAALAAAGQGKDAATLGAADRAGWRRQALTWLQADLAARARQLKSQAQAAQART